MVWRSFFMPFEVLYVRCCLRTTLHFYCGHELSCCDKESLLAIIPFLEKDIGCNNEF